jgi:acyl-[acyl-carrier-protein]-phospholipid O-acyltransferase/long-chain-fatty-acid--[acyl-carrier-protein] ligase
MQLPRALVRQCKRKKFQSKIADTAGSDLSGGSLLMRTLILRRLLLREVLSGDETHVGVLLPPSGGGVIVNAALALCGRVSANLNYTVTSETMNQCIRQAGIRHVLTSRRVMEKLDLDLDAQIVYLEDFKEKVKLSDKLAGAVMSFALPAFLVDKLLGLGRIASDDVLTVIFTSGSTGEPKGVQLTHENVLSNVEAIDQLVHLRDDDVIIGILPFFHSFGYTVTLWTVLGKNIKGAYHFTPLDAKQVGKLTHGQRGTVLLATPTFLRSYLRRCTPEEFASLDVVVVGAEKMPIELAEAFEQKFGVRPVEGYGATELSPLVSVNVPPSRSLSAVVDLKEGTVGRPVPGVSAKVVDPDTLENLAQPRDAGMLLIKGPNVMAGYLGQPEKTAEVVRDGWYVTGDIAEIDEDGFIKITGRLSRFSKIGGEMVPHIRVEEELLKVAGGEDELTLAVTSLPDVKKGERLVVLYAKSMTKDPEELRQALTAAGLPNLWIPARECFVPVEEIPVLGTGKLDLRRLQELAEEVIGS